MFKPIAIISKFRPVLVLLLITSCGTSKEFAGEGRFVKRFHRPGWHVDLRSRKHLRVLPNIPEEVHLDRAKDQVVRVLGQSTDEATDHLTANTGTDNVLAVDPVISDHNRTNKAIRSCDYAISGTHQPSPISRSDQETVQENLMPKKKWNHWAIPSFLASLGTVFLAFTTLELLVVTIGIVVTLTLAGIALRRGRVHELAGKGFAIAALLIGVLAALITVISVASYGV